MLFCISGILFKWCSGNYFWKTIAESSLLIGLTDMYLPLKPWQIFVHGVASYWCHSVHTISSTHRRLGFQDKHLFQIIPPHDKGIATKILENLEPWPSSWDFSILVGSKLCQDPLSDINTKYMEDLNKLKCFGYLTCSFLLIKSECFATFIWKYIFSILY